VAPRRESKKKSTPRARNGVARVFDIEHLALGIRRSTARGATRGCSERTAEHVDFTSNSEHIEIFVAGGKGWHASCSAREQRGNP